MAEEQDQIVSEGRDDGLLEQVEELILDGTMFGELSQLSVLLLSPPPCIPPLTPLFLLPPPLPFPISFVLKSALTLLTDHLSNSSGSSTAPDALVVANGLQASNVCRLVDFGSLFNSTSGFISPPGYAKTSREEDENDTQTLLGVSVPGECDFSNTNVINLIFTHIKQFFHLSIGCKPRSRSTNVDIALMVAKVRVLDDVHLFENILFQFICSKLS